MSNLSFPLIPCSCVTKPKKIASVPSTSLGAGLMPAKFGVSSNGSMFSNARKVYNKDAGGGKNFHPSSSYTYLKKITAIGKSSSIIPLNQNLTQKEILFGKINKNDVKSALNRVRNSGNTFRNKKYVY